MHTLLHQYKFWRELIVFFIYAERCKVQQKIQTELDSLEHSPLYLKVNCSTYAFVLESERKKKSINKQFFWHALNKILDPPLESINASRQGPENWLDPKF